MSPQGLTRSNTVHIRPTWLRPRRARNPTSRGTLFATSKASETVDSDQSSGLVDRLLRNAASLLHISDRSQAFCVKCRGGGKVICPVCKGATTHGVHSAGGLKTNRCLTCHGTYTSLSNDDGTTLPRVCRPLSLCWVALVDGDVPSLPLSLRLRLSRGNFARLPLSRPWILHVRQVRWKGSPVVQ